MQFWKYEGAGNDFILLDQRSGHAVTRADTDVVARLCDRHFGIGADGLMLLQSCPGYDFEMVYFNADGRESSMCGNGGRCIAAFARYLGIVDTHCTFLAIDGAHEAVFSTVGNTEAGQWVELKMRDVTRLEKQENAYVLDTGSPHFIRFVDTVENLDMRAEGRAVRYADPFRAEGINVNLVSPDLRSGQLNIRTYERGVEDETLACGTGVTAAAIAWFVHRGQAPAGLPVEIPVQARGGAMTVRFRPQADGSFTDIWLCGPSRRVFSGQIDV